MGSDKPVPIKKSKFDLYNTLGISYFLIMVFLIIIPTKTITENIEVSYLDKETYYEKEPYEVQEYYQEQEPYQGQESYQEKGYYEDIVYKDIVYNTNSGKPWKDWDSNCRCTDYNPWPNIVCVQKTCKEPQKVTKYGTVTKYRPVTKYRTVTKSRTVTKYKDVPKIRDVTKTRIEPRPAEVNWVLGFKTPYTLHLPSIE